jgi:hypothetical protein
VRERAEDQEPVLCCEGKGKEGVDEAASPLGMFCQEGRDERGSAKRRATSHHARLGMANAQLLCHLLSSHRVMSIHAALGQLHVEANGSSQVAEGAEGSVSGRALQVAVIGKGEDPYLGMELLGLLQGGLKGEAKHQHATRVALAYPALREEGLGALGSTTHKEPRVLAVGPLDEGEEVRDTPAHCAASRWRELKALQKSTWIVTHSVSASMPAWRAWPMQPLPPGTPTSIWRGWSLIPAAHPFMAHRPARRCQTSAMAMGRTPPPGFWMQLGDVGEGPVQQDIEPWDPSCLSLMLWSIAISFTRKFILLGNCANILPLCRALGSTSTRQNFKGCVIVDYGRGKGHGAPVTSPNQKWGCGEITGDRMAHRQFRGVTCPQTTIPNVQR